MFQENSKFRRYISDTFFKIIALKYVHEMLIVPAKEGFCDTIKS